MRSLQLKMIAFSLAVLTAVTAVFTGVTYYTSMQKLEHLLGEKAQGIAAASAALIDGDKHQLIVENIQNAEKTKEYAEIQQQLRRIKQANQLSTDVYTLTEAYWLENTMVFIVSSSEKPFEIRGQVTEPHIKQSITKKTKGYKGIYKTINGYWISGYAPLLTSDGQVSGVLEVSLDATKEVQNAKLGLLKIILFASVVAMMASFLMIAVLSRKISKPIKRLTETARRIAEGDLEVAEEYYSKDEIGRLSKSVKIMAEKIALTYAQYQQATDNAQRANEAKSQFLANMTHEIRTPISLTISLTELLKDSDLNEAQQKIVERIESANQLSLTVMSEILDFAKIEAGTFEMHPEETNILQLCDEVIEAFSGAVNAKEIEIFCRSNIKYGSTVLIDPDKVRQVLVNYIGNAVKFTETGHVTLSCNYIKGKLEIRVKDTGIGLKPEDQDEVFKPFVQAENKSNRTYGGTGLGLSICKKVIEGMQGEVGVISEFHVGSEFYAIVPCQLTQAKVLVSEKVAYIGDSREFLDQMEVIVESLQCEPFPLTHIDEIFAVSYMIKDLFISARSYDRLDDFDRRSLVDIGLRVFVVSEFSKEGLGRSQLAGAEKIVYKPLNFSKVRNLLSGGEYKENSVSNEIETLPCVIGARVLVAEDNEMNQEVIGAVLEKMGCDYYIVSNGEEVIDQVQRADYDLILMDCQMPKMDGYQATVEIRKCLDWEIPIIALTANSFTSDRQRCLEAGMTEFMTKPIEVVKLIKMIDKYRNQSDRKVS